MSVKHKIRNLKYETIWIHTCVIRRSVWPPDRPHRRTSNRRMEIQNPEFSKQEFQVGWPEIRATFKAALSSTELRTGSIIRATCAFDAKKVVPGMKTGELTRCQKRNKKIFAFFNFYLWLPVHLVENRAVRYPRSFVESVFAPHQSGL